MLPLYLTELTPGLIFWLLYWTWAVAEVVTSRRLWNAEGAVQRDRGSRVAVVVTFWSAILVAFALAVAVPGASIGWSRHILFYVGASLLLIGLLLRQYAIATLGGLHSLAVATRAGQPVVQTGPYSWIRHPSYAGSLLTAAAIILCSTNWLCLVCLLPVAAGYAYRIRVEERALAEDLGEPYLLYMRRTKRLIPYVF